jgi:hypothetical protein
MDEASAARARMTIPIHPLKVAAALMSLRLRARASVQKYMLPPAACHVQSFRSGRKIARLQTRFKLKCWNIAGHDAFDSVCWQPKHTRAEYCSAGVPIEKDPPMKHIIIAAAALCLGVTAASAQTATPPSPSGAGGATKLSQSECTNLWQQANKTGAAGLTQAQAAPYVTDFKAANPDGDTTIDQNEWMAACNKGLVKSSSSSGAASGTSGSGSSSGSSGAR